MLDILIVNYNCTTYLQKLLETLVGREGDVLSRRANYTITVVDNHSTDGSATMVESQFPSVNLIPNSSNMGYAAAVNNAIASTKNREVLLLNSDVDITPAAIVSLLRIWERLDFPGVLAPLHLEEDGFPQLTWGAYPTPQAEARRRQLDRAASHRETWARKALLAESCKTREVDWVSGSCMLFARSTVEDTGPWDQNFFLFFEDIDWCLRVKEKGYPIYHTSEIQIVHAHGASVDSDPETAEIEYRQSQTYFTKKHLGSWSLFRLKCYLTCKQMGRWLIGSRSGFDRSVSYQIFRDLWRKIEI